MSRDDLPPEEQLALKYGAQALQAALSGDWPAAYRLISATGRECGGPGVCRALIAWADTMIRYTAGGPAEDGQQVHLAFMQAETGRVHGADEAPPAVRWAGQLIAARAARDEQAWHALVDALPADGNVVGDHVAAVLQVVTATLTRAIGAAGVRDGS